MLPMIDKMSGEPIRRQLYQQLKAQILSGTLAQGEALFSTRQLASELSVSRSTVVEAYDMLLAEGFLESRQGSQTLVAGGVAIPAPNERIASAEKQEQIPVRADFTTGRPDLSAFPRGLWLKAIQTAAKTLSDADFGYTGPNGYAPLRKEISAWLSRSRGIMVDPDDVFITSGATHALRILSDLLCPNGGRVILEDPCHKGLYDTLLASNCSVIPVPADDHGICAELLTSQIDARMIYITPSHQFPLGGILPASRRVMLIRFARERDMYIVEDDYDSEFRFSGAPISPLYALDAQRVVYVGTFSKSVFPALRIGFALLPKALQSRWKYLRTHSDVQNPILDQAALAAFLESRVFDRTIRASKSRYEKRRNVLIQALVSEFGSDCAICGDAAGLHLSVRLKGHVFNDAFERRCRENGIIARTMEWHCIEKGKHLDQLVLGYGHLEPEQIEKSVRLLAQAILQHRKNPTGV